MGIESAPISTGSFNGPKGAEKRDVEHLLVNTEAPELVKVYEQNIRAHAMHTHCVTKAMRREPE